MNRDLIVTQLEEACLPVLSNCAEGLRSRHPSFEIRIGSGSVGGATTYQGHHAYLECFRAESNDPEPNCVAIEIGVRGLDAVPMLCDLGVGWGGDGTAPRDGSIDLGDPAEPWSANSIPRIMDALPTLIRELELNLIAWEQAYPK
jgi:hypothetical protein